MLLSRQTTARYSLKRRTECMPKTACCCMPWAWHNFNTQAAVSCQQAFSRPGHAVVICPAAVESGCQTITPCLSPYITVMLAQNVGGTFRYCCFHIRQVVCQSGTARAQFTEHCRVVYILKQAGRHSVAVVCLISTVILMVKCP